MTALSAIVDREKPRLLTRGGASEGPVWHPDGYLTFVRDHLSQLIRWDPDGTVSVIRTETGNGNGCALDREGRLLMCEGGHQSVTRTELDGSIITIADEWRGKPLVKPNDIVCRSDGSVYFTDPGYWNHPGPQLKAVFRLGLDGRLDLATDECEHPNGLAFSPDESTLYVAISGVGAPCVGEERRGELCPHRRIRSFDVAPDGSLSNTRIFADMSSSEPGVPDGLRVDADGRVYCAGSGGIWVIERTGKRLGVIRLPERPRNLAFGGVDLKTLFVTTEDALYSIGMKVPGLIAPNTSSHGNHQATR